MVREANVEKRLEWAKENCEDINLDNLVFTDETTVQLENHRWVIYLLQERLQASIQAQAKAPN
jgi:hypothetical protein